MAGRSKVAAPLGRHAPEAPSLHEAALTFAACLTEAVSGGSSIGLLQALELNASVRADVGSGPTQWHAVLRTTGSRMDADQMQAGRQS